MVASYAMMPMCFGIPQLATLLPVGNALIYDQTGVSIAWFVTTQHFLHVTAFDLTNRTACALLRTDVIRTHSVEQTIIIEEEHRRLVADFCPPSSFGGLRSSHVQRYTARRRCLFGRR
jgi:hypothetical protein